MTDPINGKSRVRILDITGKRFGKLVAMKYHHSERKRAHWECLCDCGKTHITATSYLNTGDVTSCGCIKSPIKSVLGINAKKVRGHASWSGLLDRCYNASSKDYERYGKRGITVCDRWRASFLNFHEDMGEKPVGLSVERRDNSLGYSPENCYWGTSKQQCRNRRSNTLITIDGETKCLVEWREIKGISKSCYQWRVRNGWTPERALTTPIVAGKGEWVLVVPVKEAGSDLAE